MYPSIKYALVEEAVDYFSKNLNTDESTEMKIFINVKVCNEFKHTKLQRKVL